MRYLDEDSPEPEYPTWVFDVEEDAEVPHLGRTHHRFLRDAVYPKHVARVDNGNGIDATTGERIPTFGQWLRDRYGRR